MKVVRVLGLLCCLLGRALSASAQETVTWTPPEPEQVPFVPEDAGTLSQLAVTFEATYGELQALGDRKLPRRLEGKDRVTQGSLTGEVRYTVTREGALKVRPEGGGIALEVPLAFKARFSGGAGGLGLPFSAEADGSLTATLVTRPVLNPDWTVSTRPVVRLAWRKAPGIHVLGARLTFQGLADRFLNDWVESKKARLDPILNENLKLKQRAEKVWKDLGKPLKIGEEPPLWLVVRPERFRASALETGPGGVKLSAGLDARITALAGAIPVLPLAYPSLPPLATGGPLDGAFRVILPATVHYAFINGLIAQNWSGRDVDLPMGGKVHLERFGVGGSGDRFVITAEVTGTGSEGRSAQGRMQLSGKPVYDPATRTLRVTGLTADPGTVRAVSAQAAWLLEGPWIQALGDSLVFPVGERLDQLRSLLEGALAGGRPYGDLVLTGKVEGLGVVGVRVDGQGIHARGEAHGTLKVGPRK